MEAMGLSGFTVDQLSGLMVGGVLGAVLGGFAVIGFIIQAALTVLSILGSWKIYGKLGEPGWKCLIPFYNSWVEYQYTWKPIMAIPVWVLGVGCGLLMEYVAQDSPLYLVLSVLSLVGWVFSIIGYHKLSKSFGHGVGFTIGMVLVPSIFMAILGLGKSQYIGNTAIMKLDAPAAEDESVSK